MTPPIKKRLYELLDLIELKTIHGLTPTEKKEYSELSNAWWKKYDKMNQPTENFGF